MTVAGDLYAIRQSARKIADEACSRLAVPIADEPAGDQLGIGANTDPAPNITRRVVIGAFAETLVARLHADEAPNFVELEPLAPEVPQLAVLVVGADTPGIDQKFAYRILRHTRNADGGTNAVAFH